jgi:NAD-dependent DNA ligase (contains BRCT domain type II)
MTGEKCMDVKKKYEELKREILYHNDLCYNKNHTEIDDYTYDAMMQEIKLIENQHPEWITADSPTQIVGGEAKREAGVLVRHNVPSYRYKMRLVKKMFSILLKR